ncbi:type I restriction-modification system subunit M [Peptostreptococcus stomatis]|uniref:type I restriction-modification system subunit M n=1 Tax=Peptostreptococcus stomatis TaxID=341694 RepID=UPI0028D56B2F|nr:type I restriction-modification system subunit M [Peptostreptococcus stomatis]
MNKQQLANKIWESANKMRSKIEANEYKDYILGFIFYKYLSDQEIKFLKENDFDDADIKDLREDDIDILEYVQRNIGYFISYENLFSTWISKGRDFDVSDVRDALSAFNRLIYPTHKKVFDKVFDTLQTGLSKLGDSSNSQTKAISGLLQLIKDIPMDGKQDYDVLGFIYEYLISQFAANAGKKAGEFYTPHEVSVLMSEIVAEHLKGKKEIKIYDPTSGSGSLLINIGNCISKYMPDSNNIKYYAQELKENTYNLTRMNLVMRGIRPDNIVTRNGDTLEEDWPFFDENDPVNTYNPLYVDSVVSNPPYSQAWDPSNKEHDPRYSRFGLAPKGKADYAFLLHDLFHIKPDGIMTIVLPHGVLFRGGEEGQIRKNLIENNHIDTIIGLPANIFFGTGIPTIIIVLKQKRENTDTLIIDASKGFIKEGKNNKLRASDIKRIVDAVMNRESIDKFSRLVSREEIRSNDYNLNIPRYVDSSEPAETWDLYASMFGGIPMTEIDGLEEYWKAFPTLKSALFTNSDIPYVELATEDIKNTIKNHADIKTFENAFKDAFADFHLYLKKEWIEKMEHVEISKSENVISENIFKRLDQVPLIDKYEAYQILDDEWGKIAVDLEIIQTEGFAATKKVDPNLVTKKKDGKEQEIQDGWIGRVIPFELVQKELLSDRYKELREKEARLAEIPSLYEEIIEDMTEEEKDGQVLNDNNDAFVAKEVTKKIKELKKEAPTEEVKSFIDKLDRYERLSKEEKDLKKEIKSETAKLHMLTKETIENLTDSMVCELLDKKWIGNLLESINKLPDTIVDNLVSKIQALVSKYKTTYFELEKEIKETEIKLASMIDELEGNEYDMKGLSEFKALLLGE